VSRARQANLELKVCFPRFFWTFSRLQRDDPQYGIPARMPDSHFLGLRDALDFFFSCPCRASRSVCELPRASLTPQLFPWF